MEATFPSWSTCLVGTILLVMACQETVRSTFFLLLFFMVTFVHLMSARLWVLIMEDKVLSGMYLHHCLSFFGLFNVSSASAYVKTFKKRGRVAVNHNHTFSVHCVTCQSFNWKSSSGIIKILVGRAILHATINLEKLSWKNCNEPFL